MNGLLYFLLFCSVFAQEIIDANLIDGVGASEMLETVIKLKDVIESPNCLPEYRFRPLVEQLIGQTNCRSGVSLLSVMTSSSSLDVSAVTYPYLQQAAYSSLLQVVSNSSSPLRISRAFIPFPQQYLQFRQSYLRVCGQTTLQPYVGTTALERGDTIEVASAATADAWESFFLASGNWARRSAVLFQYIGPDVLDAGERTIVTFQSMWSQQFPWDIVRATGTFDSATQLRAEMAPVLGLQTLGLCQPSSSSSSSSLNSSSSSSFWSPFAQMSSQDSLLLIILIPMMCAALGLLAFVAYYNHYFQSITPFDTSGDGRENETDYKIRPADIPSHLHNSVEDTTELSEYARSSFESDGEERTNDQTSGIWGPSSDDEGM